tara:strand:- start:13 stop:1380 length:1368 start_codon:yes stop_codon:yes gene_type:complete
MSKSLPQSEDYEKSVLSTCLQEPDRIPDAIELGINQDSFFCYPSIWRSIEELHAEDKEIELISFISYLTQKGRLEGLGGDGGGHAFVTSVYTYATSGAHLHLHSRKLKDLEFRRKAIRMAGNIEEAARDLDEDVMPLLLTPIDKLVEGVGVGEHCSTGKEALSGWLEDWQANLETGVVTNRIKCGVPAIDDSRGGLDSPGVACVAGLPSSGKTALAIQVICYHLVNYPNARILDLSLEMTAKQLAQRCMIHLCGFDDPRWIREPYGALSDFIRTEAAEGRKVSHPPKRVLDKIAWSAKILASDQFIIEDDAGMDIHQCLAKAKVHMRKGDLTLVVADHIQLIAGNSKQQGVELQMTETSHGIMRGAKTTNCTWLELSQLTEKANGSMAMKYAATIEEDAHVAYRIRSEREKSEIDGLVVVKDREGGTKGKLLSVDWDGAKQTFKRACHAERESLI